MRSFLIGLRWATTLVLLAICSRTPEGLAHRENTSASLAGARPFAARLSGSSHKGYRPRPVRLTESSRKRLAELSRKSKPSASDLHEFAILIALKGKTDVAVELLLRARAIDPDSATIQNDLAALKIVQAEETRQASTLVEAVALLDSSISEDRAREVRFNRALALEKLGLLFMALVAWEEARVIEASEGWRREIDVHIATLRQSLRAASAWSGHVDQISNAAGQGDSARILAIVKEFPQESRLWAENQILQAAVGDLRLPGDSRELLMAGAVGAVLAKLGDYSVQDTVEKLVLLGKNSVYSREMAFLKSGSLHYLAGLEAYESGNFMGAAEEFERASLNLSKTETPLAGWATLQLARCKFQAADYSQVKAKIGRILSDFDSTRYPSLVGKALWVLGLTSLIQGSFNEAINQLSQSLQLYVLIGEHEGIAAVQGILSQAYESTGEIEAAWRHRWAALQVSRKSPYSNSRYVALEEGALAALGMRKPEVALYFQEELWRLASATKDPVMMAGALRDKASVEIKLQRFDLAHASADKAVGIARTINDAGVKEAFLGDLLAVRGASRVQHEPEAAIEDLDAALEISKDTDYQLLLWQIYLSRSRAYKRLGLLDKTEVELEAAISDREVRRSRLHGDDRRSAFFETARAAFDEMVALQMERNRSSQAFDYTERGRARALLDWLSIGNDAPDVQGSQIIDSSSKILCQIPAGTSVLTYWVVGGRLYLWVLGQCSIHAETLTISQVDLGRLVGRTIEAAGSGRLKEFNVAAASLYDVLVRPVQLIIRDSSAIVFVPDFLFQEVPFSALMDSRTQRYLVEDFSVSVAPSVNVYAECLRQAKSRWRPLSRILLVADPQFDRDVFRGMPRLGYSVEQKALRAAFPESEVLVGSDATQAGVLEAIARSTGIIFSGHSLVDANVPLKSMLLLAPDARASDSGILYAHEILRERRRFANVSFAVLAACDSARGRVYRGEGAWSIARTFLAAGVPQVVATLWKVDGVGVSKFMASFYENLRLHGSDVVVALRATQLQFIKGSNSSSVAIWAAFEALGS